MSYIEKPDDLRKLDALRREIDGAYQSAHHVYEAIRQRRDEVRDLVKTIILDNELLRGTSWRIANDSILCGGKIRLIPERDRSFCDLQYVLSLSSPDWVYLSGRWEDGTSVQLWMGDVEIAADDWNALTSFADEVGMRVVWDREKIRKARESLEEELKRLNDKRLFIDWLHLR